MRWRRRLGYETGGAFRVLADLDGRYLSTEVATGFIGRVIGRYVVAGTASCMTITEAEQRFLVWGKLTQPPSGTAGMVARICGRRSGGLP